MTDFTYHLDPSWSIDTSGLGRSVPDASVAPTGEVFVLSRDPGAVHVFDGTTAALLRSFGSEELSDGPHGITVGGDRVYVVDMPDHVVRVFSTSGELLEVIGSGRASDSGANEGTPVNDRWRTVQRGAPPFNLPAKAALGATGLFVSDGYANARIHRFDREGRLQASWGGPGAAPGGFSNPHSVLVLSNGEVAVADRDGGRVQLFQDDGARVREVPLVGRPAALAEAHGHLVVAELAYPDGSTTPAISIIARDGTIQARVTSFAGGEPFGVPHGLAGDDRGILVVDLALKSVTRAVRRGEAQRV